MIIRRLWFLTRVLALRYGSSLPSPEALSDLYRSLNRLDPTWRASGPGRLALQVFDSFWIQTFTSNDREATTWATEVASEISRSAFIQPLVKAAIENKLWSSRHEQIPTALNRVVYAVVASPKEGSLSNDAKAAVLSYVECLFQHNSRDSNYLGLYLLLNLRCVESLPFLRRFLTGEIDARSDVYSHDQLARKTANYLKQQPDLITGNLLRYYLKSSDEHTLKAVREALAVLDKHSGAIRAPNTVVERLVQELHNSADTRSVDKIAHALAEMRATSAVPALCNHLTKLRPSIFEALGLIGDGRALHPLVVALFTEVSPRGTGVFEVSIRQALAALDRIDHTWRSAKVTKQIVAERLPTILNKHWTTLADGVTTEIGWLLDEVDSKWKESSVFQDHRSHLVERANKAIASMLESPVPASGFKQIVLEWLSGNEPDSQQRREMDELVIRWLAIILNDREMTAFRNGRCRPASVLHDAATTLGEFPSAAAYEALLRRHPLNEGHYGGDSQKYVDDALDAAMELIRTGSREAADAGKSRYRNVSFDEYWEGLTCVGKRRKERSVARRP